MLLLNPNISIATIEEGIAFFDCFTGNTHFLSSPHTQLINLLTENPYAKSVLLEKLFENKHKNTENDANDEQQFEQFIAEALKSGIIIES